MARGEGIAMQNIPDTGPGVSGFLAAGLWRAYAHFPWSGQHDWLLLFLGVGLAVHLLFLPHLWTSIQHDMDRLRESRTDETMENQGMPLSLWAIACLTFGL